MSTNPPQQPATPPQQPATPPQQPATPPQQPATPPSREPIRKNPRLRDTSQKQENPVYNSPDDGKLFERKQLPERPQKEKEE